MSENFVLDIGNTSEFAPSVAATYMAASGGTLVGFPVDMLNTGTFCNVFLMTHGISGVLQVQVQTSDVQSGVFWSGGGFPPSGTYVDPTSGFSAFPSIFASGGNVYFNSGLYTLPGAGWFGSGQPAFIGNYPAGTYPYGTTAIFNSQGGNATIPLGATISGPLPVFASGGIGFASFQRTQRFGRVIVMAASGVGGAGATASGVQIQVLAGFLAQLDSTGSGGGYSWLPGSGAGATALV